MIGRENVRLKEWLLLRGSKKYATWNVAYSSTEYKRTHSSHPLHHLILPKRLNSVSQWNPKATYCSHLLTRCWRSVIRISVFSFNLVIQPRFFAENISAAHTTWTNSKVSTEPLEVFLYLNEKTPKALQFARHIMAEIHDFKDVNK